MILEKATSSFFFWWWNRGTYRVFGKWLQFGTQNINMLSQNTYIYIALYILKILTVVISSCVCLTVRNKIQLEVSCEYLVLRKFSGSCAGHRGKKYMNKMTNIQLSWMISFALQIFPLLKQIGCVSCTAVSWWKWNSRTQISWVLGTVPIKTFFYLALHRHHSLYLIICNFWSFYLKSLSLASSSFFTLRLSSSWPLLLLWTPTFLRNNQSR